MAYHYSFMMKVAVDREPETFGKATKNPRWVEAMNEEMREWDIGSRPSLTSQEGNRLQMDIQGEV